MYAWGLIQAIDTGSKRRYSRNFAGRVTLVALFGPVKVLVRVLRYTLRSVVDAMSRCALARHLGRLGIVAVGRLGISGLCRVVFGRIRLVCVGSHRFHY
jgi:hypothetical protein